MTERNIIQRLIAIDTEEHLREERDKLKHYNTGEKIHKKQLAFHKCEKRNRWVFGGNRSGKSECGAVECVYLARGIHPYRKNKDNVFGWVVSLSTQVQRDVAQQKVLSYLHPEWIKDIVMASGRKESPDLGIIDTIVVENVFGGTSRIGFKSCDQGREKFQGTSLDFVWFDEEPPKDVYDECRMRVIDRVGDIFGTMTPLKGLTWVYDEIFLNSYNDSQIWHIEMEWADNPYLNIEEIENISKNMSTEQLDCRRYGKFVGSSGLVYKEFQQAVHVIPPFDVPKEWFDCISIDPGLNNPLSAHWYAVDGDGTVFVIAEHYEAGRDIGYHSERLKAISSSLDWHTDSAGRINALIDSAAGQRTLASCKSVVELFYDNGILVNPKVNKDVFSGINRVKSYLKLVDGKPKIYIFENCVNLIREFKGYWWGDNDSPKKHNDHALDELRYYLMTKPKPDTPVVAKTPIQLDKERLYRKLLINRKGD